MCLYINVLLTHDLYFVKIKYCLNKLNLPKVMSMTRKCPGISPVKRIKSQANVAVRYQVAILLLLVRFVLLLTLVVVFLSLDLV